MQNNDIDNNLNTEKTVVILEPGIPQNSTPDKQTFQKQQKKDKKQFSISSVVAVCLICSILSAFLSVCAFSIIQSSNDKNEINSSPANFTQNTSNTPSPTEGPSNKDENNITIIADQVYSPATAVAKKVSPSIVGIRVTTITNYGPYGNYESSSDGSGVIYTHDGYIITNYHVIEGMLTSSGENDPNSKLAVYLYQDTSNKYDGTVIGYDQRADLAVIKINAQNLSKVEIGNSDNINVGDIAIAIGNPGGLDFMGSTSQGIISGLNRSIQTENSYENLALIQTDAAINPGNSGGALCDKNGRLIGINSVKLVETGYESMGFAIPSNDVVEICNAIIKNGGSSNIYLGLEFNESFTAEILNQYGYPSGIVVSRIAEGSPADVGGFEIDDILTKFNGKDISSTADLIEAKKTCKPGDRVTAKVYRLTLERYGFTQKWVGNYIDLIITFE